MDDLQIFFSFLYYKIKIINNYGRGKSMKKHISRESLQKYISMTGERARIDAKIHNTYIVYKNVKGIVKEYPNGKVEIEGDGENE